MCPNARIFGICSKSSPLGKPSLRNFGRRSCEPYENLMYGEILNPSPNHLPNLRLITLTQRLDYVARSIYPSQKLENIFLRAYGLDSRQTGCPDVCSLTEINYIRNWKRLHIKWQQLFQSVKPSRGSDVPKLQQIVVLSTAVETKFTTKSVRSQPWMCQTVTPQHGRPTWTNLTYITQY